MRQKQSCDAHRHAADARSVAAGAPGARAPHAGGLLTTVFARLGRQVDKGCWAVGGGQRAASGRHRRGGAAARLSCPQCSVRRGGLSVRQVLAAEEEAQAEEERGGQRRPPRASGPPVRHGCCCVLGGRDQCREASKGSRSRAARRRAVRLADPSVLVAAPACTRPGSPGATRAVDPRPYQRSDTHARTPQRAPSMKRPPGRLLAASSLLLAALLCAPAHASRVLHEETASFSKPVRRREVATATPDGHAAHCSAHSTAGPVHPPPHALNRA